MENNKFNYIYVIIWVLRIIVIRTYYTTNAALELIVFNSKKHKRHSFFLSSALKAILIFDLNIIVMRWALLFYIRNMVIFLVCGCLMNRKTSVARNILDLSEHQLHIKYKYNLYIYKKLSVNCTSYPGI